MAYIKFKELTPYFNFYKKLDVGELPKYVYQYISKDEDIYGVYSTKKDKCVFTSKKLILFDLRSLLGISKNIYMFPLQHVSSSSIIFKRTRVSIMFIMDSGYQLKLNYVSMNADDKIYIRKVYGKIIENIIK